VSTLRLDRTTDRQLAWWGFGLCAATFLLLRLSLVPAHLVDLHVYRAEGLALREGLDLYGVLPGVHGLATYPPFAAALFVPVSLLPEALADSLSLLVNLGLLLGACYLALGRIAAARPQVHVAAPVLAAVALWCEPVMGTSTYGQVNLAILCLVLWDFSLPPESRWKGVGIGLAAAVKVTPGIFVVHLVLTRQAGAARTAVLTFLGSLAVSALLVPTSTVAFWTRHLFDPDRVGRVENSVNQSLLGVVVRAGHTTEPGLWARGVAVAVLVAGLACAMRCHRRLHELAAVLVVALTGLLVSPISWSHHWVWCVPLLALAWYEARALLVPTLLVFWSYVVWWVPHGSGVELRLDPLHVGLSACYVVYAVGCIAYLTIRARTGPVQSALR
jgi:alpha-1,2-mannosyltransferase